MFLALGCACCSLGKGEVLLPPGTSSSDRLLRSSGWAEVWRAVLGCGASLSCCLRSCAASEDLILFLFVLVSLLCLDYCVAYEGGFSAETCANSRGDWIKLVYC